MKKLIILLLSFQIVISCQSKKGEVKNPFGAAKYQTNRKYFRASASGVSTNYETSRDKALLSAKQRLASAIQTQINNVAESYKGERNISGLSGDFNERYQQLTREVTSVLLLDIKTIDEKTFKNADNTYTTYIALEARKKNIYRNFKEQAKVRSTLSKADKELIEKMIDKAIQETGDND
ncbi:MAG: hypothetical protein ACK4K9_10300 [Bacteroidia bacterium]